MKDPPRSTQNQVNHGRRWAFLTPCIILVGVGGDQGPEELPISPGPCRSRELLPGGSTSLRKPRLTSLPLISWSSATLAPASYARPHVLCLSVTLGGDLMPSGARRHVKHADVATGEEF